MLKDWSEVNDALRSIHEYEHALTEMSVDMSRRIDAVKAEYTKSAEPLQKRVKKLEKDVQEYVEAHREDMAGKSRQLTFGRVGSVSYTHLDVYKRQPYRLSSTFSSPAISIDKVLATSSADMPKRNSEGNCRVE